MSFVGKLLIVVQVVFSVCFLAFAGAVYVTQENWKQKSEQGEQALVAAKATTAQVEQNLSQARDELAKIKKDSEEQVNDIKLKFQTAEAALANLQAEFATLSSNFEQQQTIARVKQQEAEFREKESEVLRAQNGELQSSLDQVTADLNIEKDKVFNVEVALRNLQTRFDNLMLQTAFLEKVVRKHDLPTDPSEVVNIADPPPALEGEVAEVSKGRTGRTELVEITVGSDDGLAVGHELDATRFGDGLYLGRMRVISVEPDQAVCEVIAPSKLGDIEVGDHVSTKL